ncbi:N-acetyl-gamma-glutamyl-phosphate reductase [Alteromonas halophila]|nr:N-acetyl-gamma-glutamyl-phosphate reductase [Alteromonas halophila]
MNQVAIIGASGYTGAQLVQLVDQHPSLTLSHVCVSASSADANKPLSAIHGQLAHLDYQLSPVDDEMLDTLCNDVSMIFLATPHEVSHDWMPRLMAGTARVFDLSGAFRLKDEAIFSRFYGFEHRHATLLSNAVYGLAEWYAEDISNASLVAVPGCYPTASLSALKPLINNTLVDTQHYPVINAVSGVTGAGRKASLTNSFCEVSLSAYGILSHRHTPEISAYLGTPVIFTPHLGNFKRGILATVTVKLNAGVSHDEVNDAFYQAYADSPLVRLRQHSPKLDDVVKTPFVDLYWQYDPASGYVVVTAAIDNLMKGAASQAIQCANLTCGWPQQTGLLL